MSKFIAIDLDSQGLFIVAGSGRGQAKVEQAVAWPGTEADGGPPVLTPESAKRIGEQLRDRLRAAGIGNLPVLVAIPRDRVVVKELRYPAVAPTEEPNVVRFQAIKELSEAPEDVILDYVPLSNGAASAAERRSVAVVVRKDLYGAIQGMCTAAGLKLAAVTPRPYATAAGIARAIAANAVTPPDSKDDAVANLTLGPGGGEFTVSRGGEVTFARNVPGPSVASEPMLLADVRRNLAMFAGANPGHPVQALYVAESDGRVAPRFRSALGIPVSSYDPLQGAVPELPADVRGRFAGAAGLLAARAAGDLPINFAAIRQPTVASDPMRKQVVVAALVALLLIAAGGVYGWMKLGAADEELSQLAQRRDGAKQQLDQLEPEGKRLAAADAWKARRVVWLDELFDMADRFPNAPGFHASIFTGQSLPPDRKTGKQENQAKIDVKVTARNPDPVDTVVAAMLQDSTDRNPANPKAPAKFYVGARKMTGGPSQSESGALDYTIVSLVNNRPGDKFTRVPATFPVPSRKGYPPAPVGTKEKEKEKEPEPADKESKDKDAKVKDEAPAPRTKDATGEE